MNSKQKFLKPAGLCERLIGSSDLGCEVEILRHLRFFRDKGQQKNGNQYDILLETNTVLQRVKVLSTCHKFTSLGSDSMAGNSFLNTAKTLVILWQEKCCAGHQMI